MFEDYYCFSTAAGIMLPKRWRNENCRIRRKLAKAEYHCHSTAERAGRLLDDLWPELYARVTDLSDVVGGISALKTVDELAQSKAMNELRIKFDRFLQNFTDFTKSPYVVEILRSSDAKVKLQLEHAYCCPQPPQGFTPHLLQFPPAGYFLLFILCIQNYMRAFVYSLLYGEELQDEGGNHAYELCRTFAGLEYAFGDNQDALIPAFPPLVTAGFTCPPALRVWLWHKLAHFEQCGPFSEPIRKTLSVYWCMPELASEGFHAWKNKPPERQSSAVVIEDIDLATSMAKLNLDETDDS